MSWTSDTAFDLVDARQRRLGRMTVERDGGGLLVGTFAPGPDFPAVSPLFERFEEAAESQALAAVERLDAEINALGLHLRRPDGSGRVEVHDVQIWSDGGMTCRHAGSDLVMEGGGVVDLATTEPSPAAWVQPVRT